MMKNLQKILNNEPLPWVSLIWGSYYSVLLPSVKLVGQSYRKSHLKLLHDYRLNCECKLGNGQATLLYHDKWLEQPLLAKFPELHSYVKSDTQIVAIWIEVEESTQFFHTPMST